MSQATDLHAAAFEAVQHWWRAWVEKDLATVEAMVDPDYAERTDTGHLKALGPRQVVGLATCENPDCAITDWELSDPVVKLFEHVVVCSYVFHFSGRKGGQQFQFEGRATDVLNWKGGRWTFMSHEGILHGGTRSTR